jgi:hypothetical protein
VAAPALRLSDAGHQRAQHCHQLLLRLLLLRRSGTGLLLLLLHAHLQVLLLLLLLLQQVGVRQLAAADQLAGLPGGAVKAASW